MWGGWKACAHPYLVQANVDTLTSYFELDNYLFLLITSSSAKMEIRCRLGLNETLFDNWYQCLYPKDGRKKRKTRVKRLCVTNVTGLWLGVLPVRYLTLMCSVFSFLQKNPFQGCWRLVESFFKQNDCQASQKKSAVFFLLPSSCCVCSLKILNPVDSRTQQNTGQPVLCC